jgi:dolichol-phosphate mannosyltransferase
MNQDRQIWVVVPTFNEASNLPRLVDALRSLELGLKVVVVDDASPDGTGDIAEQAAREWPDLEVIRRVDERGLGTAYLTGIRHALAAGASAVITMDCDFSHDPSSIPSFIDALDEAHVVVGSRYVAGGSTENWGPHRKLLSSAANRFARGLFEMPVRDCTSGFRLYRSEVLHNIPLEKIRSTGYAFLVEILFLATQGDGVRIKEVPIRFRDRERGSGKMGVREVFDGVMNLLRLRSDLSLRSRSAAAALENEKS